MSLFCPRHGPKPPSALAVHDGGLVNSSPVMANGVVYVGSYDGNVYALNARTGALLWKYTTGGAVESSPAVANGVTLPRKTYPLASCSNAKG